jgi:hypothetical protein
MNDTSEYSIGSEVACGDGVCGELVRVVVDPVARALTHLVVEPHHRRGAGRLVPIELVDASAEGIRLSCSADEFNALEDAEERRFLLDTNGQLGYQGGEVLSWPYYGLGAGGGAGPGGIGMVGSPPLITYDRVPIGEVDIRRGEHVHATDGDIGRIRGLVIDPGDHHVTHLLLDEGHLWGKKQVAIPIGAVTDVAPDGVELSLSKDEVRDLAPIDLAHPD